MVCQATLLNNLNRTPFLLPCIQSRSLHAPGMTTSGSALWLQREAGSGPEAAAQAGKPGPERPVPGNAAALNAKAEAAAAQPLPDSDESDGDDALDGVKGIMRREPPKENGAIAAQKPMVTSHVMATCLLHGLI